MWFDETPCQTVVLNYAGARRTRQAVVTQLLRGGGDGSIVGV